MTLAEVLVAVAAAIELMAAVVILVHAIRSLWAIFGMHGLDRARVILADGVLVALGFSLAATLLKVIGLQQWTQIRSFAVVFVLRTVLKRVFTTERQLAQQRVTRL